MSKYRNIEISNERGSIIVFTVLMLAAILAITLTLTRIFIPRIKAITEATNSINAVYAADSALEWCLYNNREKEPVLPRPAITNGATYQIYNDGNLSSCLAGETLSYRAVGTYRGVSRSFQIEASSEILSPTPTPTPSPSPPPPLSPTISYVGPISGSHDLSTGPLNLNVSGDYTMTVNQSVPITIRGIAGGGGGGNGRGGLSDGNGGGGGGSGSSNTSGILVSLTSGIDYSAKVGLGGLGSNGNGGNGGVTEFRISGGTIYLQLNGGNGGEEARGEPGSSTPGGVGGTVVIGTGGQNGSNGGDGKPRQENGLSGGSGEIGGGGGGGGVGDNSPCNVASGNGGSGGNSSDQSGGSSGSGSQCWSPASSGNSVSGIGGSGGSGRGSGGGGGGGGGKFLGGGIPKGGGGGGGGGGTLSGGSGGSGGPGVLVIQL